jgi:hypothetical protein
MVWSLKSGATDLWCEVVWNKYKRNDGMEEVIAKPSDSSSLVMRCGYKWFMAMQQFFFPGNLNQWIEFNF